MRIKQITKLIDEGKNVIVRLEQYHATRKFDVAFEMGDYANQPVALRHKLECFKYDHKPYLSVSYEILEGESK